MVVPRFDSSDKGTHVCVHLFLGKTTVLIIFDVRLCYSDLTKIMPIQKRFNQLILYINPTSPCGQSYKAPTSINYDHRVENISNLLVITTLEP